MLWLNLQKIGAYLNMLLPAVHNRKRWEAQVADVFRSSRQRLEQSEKILYMICMSLMRLVCEDLIHTLQS